MENKINIGELDTLVTLQKETQTIGAQGEKKFSFSDYSQVYAKIERNIAESVAFDNLESGDTVVATIWKVPELTTRWRVLIGSQKYEITSIDPIGRISFLCRLSLNAVD